jgi:hypothetical protein
MSQEDPPNRGLWRGQIHRERWFVMRTLKFLPLFTLAIGSVDIFCTFSASHRFYDRWDLVRAGAAGRRQPHGLVRVTRLLWDSENLDRDGSPNPRLLSRAPIIHFLPPPPIRAASSPPPKQGAADVSEDGVRVPPPCIGRTAAGRCCVERWEETVTAGRGHRHVKSRWPGAASAAASGPRRRRRSSMPSPTTPCAASCPRRRPTAPWSVSPPSRVPTAGAQGDADPGQDGQDLVMPVLLRIVAALLPPPRGHLLYAASVPSLLYTASIPGVLLPLPHLLSMAWRWDPSWTNLRPHLCVAAAWDDCSDDIPHLCSRLFLTRFNLVFSYFHPILDIIRLLNANPGDAFVHEPDLEKHMEVNCAEIKIQSQHHFYIYKLQYCEYNPHVILSLCSSIWLQITRLECNSIRWLQIMRFQGQLVSNSSALFLLCYAAQEKYCSSWGCRDNWLAIL